MMRYGIREYCTLLLLVALGLATRLYELSQRSFTLIFSLSPYFLDFVQSSSCRHFVPRETFC